MAQKTGRITLKLGADTLQSKAGAMLQTGGVTREADVSDAGEVFYTETTQAAEVKATLIHTAETDLEAIKATTDITIEFRCDTGRVYTVPHAFYKTDGGLQNGEIEVTFGGAAAIQN